MQEAGEVTDQPSTSQQGARSVLNQQGARSVLNQQGARSVTDQQEEEEECPICSLKIGAGMDTIST